ncbi:MAG: AEC family transporter [Firmicutes bacterium]|nr:AEC family transporter [Bacillota bacterium]
MASSISTVSIFWRVLIIFSLSIFGALARRAGWFREEARATIANLILNISLPSLIFASMTSDVTWERLALGAVAPILSLVLILLMMGLAIGLSRLMALADWRRGTFIVLCSMPNSGFIAFPVALSVFGQEGLAYAVLYDVGVTTALCTVAILALREGRGEQGSWKALINPCLMATFSALVLNMAGVRVPQLILEPLRIMGNATTPLAMLMMGYLLSGLTVGSNAVSLELGVVVVCKLLVYPFLAYLLMLPLNLDPLVKTISIMVASMPSMASTPVLVEKYGGDSEFAVAGVFVTTLLSIVTIPLMVGFFG